MTITVDDTTMKTNMKLHGEKKTKLNDNSFFFNQFLVFLHIRIKYIDGTDQSNKLV